MRENLRIPVEMELGLARRLRTTREQAATIHARVDELLELGGLSKHALRRAGEPAHGDQRAVEIMMALALRPSLLLLDEPTAGMGHEETHLIVALEIADRAYVLDNGRIVYEGTAAALRRDEARVRALAGATSGN